MIYVFTALISIGFSFLVSHPKQALFANGVEKKKRRRWSGFRLNARCWERRFFILLSSTMPFLVSALRYGIGTDYFYTYIPMFKLALEGKEEYYTVGFHFINRAVAHFTDNGQWLIVLTSMVFIGIVYHVIYRYGKNYQICILLFFLSFSYFASLNNVRQSIGAAFALLALAALLGDNTKGFAILSLLAISMHQVMLASVAVIAILWISPSAITYLVISVIWFAFSQTIAPWLLTILSKYIPRLAAYYVQTDLIEMSTVKTIGGVYFIAQLAILLILVYIELAHNPAHIAKNGFERKEWKAALFLQFLVICTCSLDGIFPAVFRIVRVFSFPQFVLLPNVIAKFEKNGRNRRILFIVVLLIYSMLFVKNTIAGIEEVFPYTSIFSRVAF